MKEPLDYKHFTGRKRARSPRKSVLLADQVARLLITSGGIGGIVAVSMVGLFLIWVVIPLFAPPAMPVTGEFETGTEPVDRHAIRVGTNEHFTLAWTCFADGTFEIRYLADGTLLARHRLPVEQAPTAWSFSIQGEHCAFGFADGTVRLGEIGFTTDFVPPHELPAALQALGEGEIGNWREGIVERTPEGQFRHQSFRLAIGEPITVSDHPIILVDQSVLNVGPMVVALDAERSLYTGAISWRTNLITGEVTSKFTSGRIELVPASTTSDPQYLLLSGLGDNVYVAWPDGFVQRYDSRDVESVHLVETTDILPSPESSLTSLTFQIGKASLVAGDDKGRLTVCYRVRTKEGDTADGMRLITVKSLAGSPAAVTALAASERTRLLAAGFADGSVRLYHITTGKQLADASLADDLEPVTLLTISPRDNALLAGTKRRLSAWRIDAHHPETTLTSLLLPVWYEGYDAPAMVWQSSSATDDFEPKYSLTPLIFGTLKATLYSMMFGLPLALLAAIYTSEFLHPRMKARVKPVIEMMASLPSVVLGFLAALVFAPFVEHVLPQALAAFVTVPLAFLLGAHLWQLIPHRTARRLDKYRLACMVSMLPVGLWSASLLGQPVESSLFAGDIMAWLDGQRGSGFGGWLFSLLPLSGLFAAFLQSRAINPWLRRISTGWSRGRFALIDLLRFVVTALLALGVALLGAWLLSSVGWDPRGSYLDTYVQRNALVVGFVMGFAVIPIIYTIAEDALSAVPDHLRAASLGAGATPWQTAVRVIIPPAMSGLFSAVMIGLGRAVGETMIVLMAAGNTPIMDWNIFNGFRTLSANIAVELPEAVQNSTHYRTLFLAALTLFLLTFLLNTAAESVRLRFRKKAFEL